MPTIRHLVVPVMRFKPLLLVVLVAFLAGAACTSRYRLEMFNVVGEHRAKIKIEKTEFYPGGVLGNPLSTDKVVVGDGNCLVLVTGARGENFVDKPEDVITFDRYDRFRVFIQLPTPLKNDTVTLQGHSFVQQLGRYEFGDDERMYYPVSGKLVIDSIAKNRLFGTLDANYENGKKVPLVFQGKFKAKVGN